MKRVFGFLLTVLCISLWGTSNINAQEKAIYIYRNDGTFNGFLNSEIDSLVYSAIDLDSIEHTNFVVQEVWTADSTYRIPLAAIDSISFNAPQPIIKSNVKFITEEYLPYIENVDGLTISFKIETPTNMLPNIGTVLVSNYYDEPFEYGFAGRVINSTVKGSTIDFTCEDVVLTDIYERLISVGNCVSADSQNASSKARRINSIDTKFFDIGKFSTDIGPITIENNPTIKMSWVIFIEPYIHPTVAITFTHTHNLSLSINSKIDGEYEPEPKWLDEASFLKNIKFLKGGYIPITTPIPGLYGKIRFGAFWSAHGDVDLSATFSGALTFVNGFKWDEKGFVPVNRLSKKEMNRPEISLNMNGSIEGGIAMQIVSGVGTDNLASMNLTLRLGPQIAVNFKASDNGIQYGGWNWYSSLKDSQLSINAYAKFSAGYKTFLDQIMGKNEYENHSVPLVTWTRPIKKWYFLPEFTKPEYTDGRQENVIVSTQPSRDLVKSVSLGFALFDNENQLVDKKYNNVNYRLENEWPFSNLQVAFEGLKKGVDYTCYPVLKIFGKELLALPETQISVGTPVQITNVEITNSTYYPEQSTYNGRSYSYKYDCAVTVKLKNKDNVEDWGYVYEDLNGDTAHISLKTMGSPYTDTRYSYYRNEPESYARLYGYVKYYGDDSFYHGEKTDYPLIYDKQPEATTLEPTCIDETWATIKCAYKESAPWNGICGVEYWKDNDHKEILFELAQDGEFEISLTGLSPNTVYYYCAFIKIDDRYIYAEDTQTIKTSQAIISICPDGHHPHLIDLGLPSGTKWQCCNVDAPSPLEAGGYYAWGETYEKAVYNRYTHSGDVVISDSHDIAYVVSNGQTRMPTHTQIQEILNNCSWTWESHNGVLGAMVTASNGNAIFLPAASFKDSNRSDYLGAPFGTYGSYWGRDLGGVVNYGVNPTLVGTELIFGILDGNIGFVPSNFYYTWGNTGWVYCGRSIRPVSAEAEPEYEFTLSTQEPVKVDAETAIVSCYFKGFREKNGVCGVQYWDDDNTYEVTIDATEDGVQEILLEGLTANTQYSYRAFVQIGNINIYADEILMFKTNTGSYPGSNHPQK